MAAQFLFWEYMFRIFGIVSLQCVHSILQLCIMLQVQGIQHGLQQERVPGRPGELAGQPLQPEAQHRHRFLRGHLPQRSVPRIKTKLSIVFDRWTLLPLQEREGGLYRGWEVSIVIRIGCKNSLGFRSTERLLTATCHFCPGYGHFPLIACTYLYAWTMLR